MKIKGKSIFSFNNRIYIAIFLLIIVSTALLSYISLKQFEREIIPEIDKKGATLSRSVISLVNKATDYGVPFNSLNGMDTYFASVMKENPEVKYIYINDLGGTTRYQSGPLPPKADIDAIHRALNQKSGKTLTVPLNNYINTLEYITVNKKRTAYLVIGTDKSFIQNRMLDIIYDIITVIIVTLLISFELVLFLVNYGIITPINSINDLLVKSRGGDFSKQKFPGQTMKLVTSSLHTTDL